MRRLFLFTAVASLLAGCASPQVNFFTNPPQARVYSKPLGEGKRTLVGVTPLSTSAKVLAANTQSSGPLLIEFEKEGFETKSMVLSDINVNNLLLNVELQPAFGVADQGTMNWLVENSFEVQRLVKARRLDEAQKLLGEMKKVAPNVATTHEMLAGIYYVKRQYNDAFASYSEALRHNPKSSEALRMTSFLKQLTKNRLPSSQDENRQDEEGE